MKINTRLLPAGSKRILSLVLLAVAVYTAWQSRQQAGFSSQLDDRHRYHQQQARVIEVVDGDTLHVDIADPVSGDTFTRVRLWGVDTPETRHPDKGVMYYGPEASEFTRQLTLNKTVELMLEPQKESRDRYDRLLAYVILPGRSVLNEEIIRQGYGYAYGRYNHYLKDRYDELQKQAKRQKTGLWKAVQPEQLPDWMKETP